MYTPKKLSKYLAYEEEEFEQIRQRADELTKKHFEDKVYVRGLIEFSNYCRCSCHYCGLRRENKKLKRFRLEIQDILACIEEGYKEGYRSFVLQSGEDPYYTMHYMREIIKEAKKIGDIALTLSIGERSYEEYSIFRKCGVDRFLIKHECADEKIYNRMHPHSCFKERLRCIVALQRLGYQTGSGFMIGLPQQTIESISKDIWLLKKLNIHMAGIGPFIPHPDTVFGEEIAGDAFMTLKAVALTRILLPDSMLPITTSLGVINPEMKKKCLEYGANVVMQKLEPPHLRRLYELYPKEVIDNTSVREEKNQLIKWLTQCEKQAVFERGDHVEFQ